MQFSNSNPRFGKVVLYHNINYLYISVMWVQVGINWDVQYMFNKLSDSGIYEQLQIYSSEVVVQIMDLGIH